MLRYASMIKAVKTNVIQCSNTISYCVISILNSMPRKMSVFLGILFKIEAAMATNLLLGTWQSHYSINKVILKNVSCSDFRSPFANRYCVLSFAYDSHTKQRFVWFLYVAQVL